MNHTAGSNARLASSREAAARRAEVQRVRGAIPEAVVATITTAPLIVNGRVVVGPRHVTAVVRDDEGINYMDEIPADANDLPLDFYLPSTDVERAIIPAIPEEELAQAERDFRAVLSLSHRPPTGASSSAALPMTTRVWKRLGAIYHVAEGLCQALAVHGRLPGLVDDVPIRQLVIQRLAPLGFRVVDDDADLAERARFTWAADDCYQLYVDFKNGTLERYEWNIVSE